MTSIKFIIQGETRLLAPFILGNHNKQETLLLGLPAEDWQFPGSPLPSQITHKFSRDKGASNIFPFLQKRPEDLSNNCAMSKQRPPETMVSFSHHLESCMFGHLTFAFLLATKPVISLKTNATATGRMNMPAHAQPCLAPFLSLKALLALWVKRKESRALERWHVRKTKFCFTEQLLTGTRTQPGIECLRIYGHDTRSWDSVDSPPQRSALLYPEHAGHHWM